jgi:hypothetical protein
LTGLNTHGLKNEGKLVIGSGHVELHHLAKKYGIAFAVGEVELSAKAVRHGVDRSQAGVGEGQAGFQAAEHHLLAGIQIPGKGDDPLNVAADQFDRLEGMQIGNGECAFETAASMA